MSGGRVLSTCDPIIIMRRADSHLRQRSDRHVLDVPTHCSWRMKKLRIAGPCWGLAVPRRLEEGTGYLPLLGFTPQHLESPMLFGACTAGVGIKNPSKRCGLDA